MAFTPSPGTGDLIDVNPGFAGPAQQDFSLSPASPCIASGADGYDRGAIPYHNRPLPVSSIICSINDSSSTVLLQWNNPAMMLDSTALSSALFCNIYRNDSLIAELFGQNPGGQTQFTDDLPQPGNYVYQISVKTAPSREGLRRRSARHWGGGALSGIAVWALETDPGSRDALLQAFQDMGYNRPVYVTADAHDFELSQNLDAVFVLLGTRPNYYYLGQGASDRLITYLMGGGNVYLEGADFWSDPVQQSVAVNQFFHVDPIDSSQAFINQMEGESGSIMQGLQFGYTGSNQSIDALNAKSGSQVLLRNMADGSGLAIGYNEQNYRSIGASFSFGDLQDGQAPNLKSEYLSRILDYFQLTTGLDAPEVNGLIAEKMTLQPNYPNPFNPATEIGFTVSKTARVTLKIYDVLGREVRT
ncbi:MAG: hypothetical protein WAN36_02085, partial [Calditrichia bacterium]